MKNSFGEFALALIFVAILVLLANPLHFWMPAPVTMLSLLVVAIVAAVYAGFVLKERAADERDDLHRMIADRAAYLAGIAVLTVALISEGFLLGRIDAWIPLAIAVMIFVKMLSRFRAARRR